MKGRKILTSLFSVSRAFFESLCWISSRDATGRLSSDNAAAAAIDIVSSEERKNGLPFRTYLQCVVDEDLPFFAEYVKGYSFSHKEDQRSAHR